MRYELVKEKSKNSKNIKGKNQHENEKKWYEKGKGEISVKMGEIGYEKSNKEKLT